MKGLKRDSGRGSEHDITARMLGGEGGEIRYLDWVENSDGDLGAGKWNGRRHSDRCI